MIRLAKQIRELDRPFFGLQTSHFKQTYATQQPALKRTVQFSSAQNRDNTIKEGFLNRCCFVNVLSFVFCVYAKYSYMFCDCFVVEFASLNVLLTAVRSTCMSDLTWIHLNSFDDIGCNLVCSLIKPVWECCVFDRSAIK